MDKNITYIHGFGKLAKALAKSLVDKGFGLYPISCSHEKETWEYKQFFVTTHDYEDTKKVMTKANNSEILNYVIVTTPGDALMEQIDWLLSLGKPLIILSTKYDEEFIRQKCLAANIPCVMSQNMALEILKFWELLRLAPKVPKNVKVTIGALESHPWMKADISGTLKVTLEILKELGFDVEFDYDKANSIYKTGKNGSYGNMEWFRDKQYQIDSYGFDGFVKSKDYLEAHAYHTYIFDIDVADEKALQYIEDLYKYLLPLNNLSIDNCLEFVVDKSDKGIYVTHDIDGRSIYGHGVIKAIDFLNTKNQGVYTGLDLISA